MADKIREASRKRPVSYNGSRSSSSSATAELKQEMVELRKLIKILKFEQFRSLFRSRDNRSQSTPSTLPVTKNKSRRGHHKKINSK